MSPWSKSACFLLILCAACSPPRPHPAAPATAPAASLSPAPSASEAGAPEIPTRDEEVQAALRLRVQRDADYWGPENRAQQAGQWIVQLWDRLRVAPDPVDVVGSAYQGELAWGELAVVRQHQLEIELLRPTAPAQTYAHDAWVRMCRDWQAAGYRLIQSEWHHERFDESPGGPPRSTIRMVLHVQQTQPPIQNTQTQLVNTPRDERWIIEGDLHVTWPSGQLGPDTAPDRIELASLQCWRRKGPPLFVLAASLPAKQGAVNHFLGVYDLDADGSPEILFDQQRYRHVGGGQYAGSPISPHRKAAFTCAICVDINRDGWPDLVHCDLHRVPEWFEGSQAGFVSPPRPIEAVSPLALPMVITASDVNQDGYLDLFLGQYKSPYRDGQMPTPYYDANDGEPSSLLINQGDGTFQDGTQEWGLAAKNRRRTYSASLAPLFDGDAPQGHASTSTDQALLVVSDFAGIDLYRQTDSLRFRDVTAEAISDHNNFGMSHRIDDFNNDGKWDVYVTGMSSTTARRLDAMQLGDPRFPEYNAMRTAMGYGNRLFFGQSHGRFEQGSVREMVARTGWSWGVTSFDLENDGDRDLYVGNGHMSGKSVKDYCSTFWRHDIYAGSSQPDATLAALFGTEHAKFAEQGSWNGFEHNCMLLQDPPGEFQQVGFLLGVACEFDTRGVVSHDVDNDGAMDLLLVENRHSQPSVLHIYRNRNQSKQHWLGVRAKDSVASPALGLVAVLELRDGTLRRGLVVAGDSFNSQHPAQIHFGLGEATEVSRLTLIWPAGQITQIEAPLIDRYHVVTAPVTPSQP